MANFIAESIEHGPPVSITPEASRRYMQWKEEDVGLLLSDLEQAGHYDKWKQNKSGYSKRVAEEVFANAMYHEAIKFKVRWLESRFRNWHHKLTAPDIIHNEQAIADTRGKMSKEFPYYDRCKDVFDPNTSTSPHVLPVDESDSSRRTSPLMDSKMGSFDMTQEPSSPILDTPKPEAISSPEKRVPIGSSIITTTANTKSEFLALKKRKIQPYTTSQITTSTSVQPPLLQQQQHSMDKMIEDRRIRLMEMELEEKKMKHEERMQQMKLEQLRLEIELQKLKTFPANPSD
ncbi:hypothetical protein K501DRAFT_325113 [Backusella circina FSU 941]|nr:hypothetical protein K501DRAFT_325113 [Backusella circina FSU 941]